MPGEQETLGRCDELENVLHVEVHAVEHRLLRRAEALRTLLVLESDHGGRKPDVMPDLVDQIRLLAKSGDKRISYIIFDGKIASSKKAWRWRPYDGINKHNHHAHVSFTPKGDEDSTWFNIPMIGGQ